MSVNTGPEFEMCVCLPCAQRLQAKQAHLVWKTEGKRGSRKLLISDRQSSLSCDSIVVEWSLGVCELSLWHVSQRGWRWAKKTYRWTRKLEERPEERWRINYSQSGRFFSRSRTSLLSPLFHCSQLSGFCEHAPPLHFRKKVCFCENVAIIAKWLPCFSKHGEALRWSLVSGPGS